MSLNPERSKTSCLVLFLFVGACEIMCLFVSYARLLPLAKFTLFTASDETNPINSTAPHARHVQCTPGQMRPVFSSDSTRSLFQQKLKLLEASPADTRSVCVRLHSTRSDYHDSIVSFFSHDLVRTFGPKMCVWHLYELDFGKALDS